MKTHWKKIVVLLIVVIAMVVAQSAYYYTMTARRAIVNDSLRVQGTTKLVGAVTIVGSQTNTGLSAFDSVTVAGDTRLGGLDNYDARLAVKNDAVNANVLDLINSRGTTVAKVDSSGDATVDSLTVNGQSWFGALVNYVSKVSIKNNTTHTYAQSWFNSRGTRIFGVDSSGGLAGNAWLRDTSTFTAGLLTKAIYIQGATTNDYYVATPRLAGNVGATTAAPPDSTSVLFCMAITDSLIVKRPVANSNLTFTYMRLK